MHTPLAFSVFFQKFGVFQHFIDRNMSVTTDGHFDPLFKSAVFHVQLRKHQSIPGAFLKSDIRTYNNLCSGFVIELSFPVFQKRGKLLCKCPKGWTFVFPNAVLPNSQSPQEDKQTW